MPVTVKDGATVPVYPRFMSEGSHKEQAPEPTQVAKNLRVLMKWRDWNQSDLARHAKVSQRHISDVLRGHSDCTTEMVGAFAKAFRVPLWKLTMEGLSEDLLTSTDLEIIVEAFVNNPQGRRLLLGAVDMVKQTAEPHK